MPEIVLYTSQTCGYCQRAKRLLDRKGVSYDEIRVDLRLVDEIPREPNGKFRAVKSAVGRVQR